jgi:hypothetical protein
LKTREQKFSYYFRVSEVYVGFTDVKIN